MGSVSLDPWTLDHGLPQVTKRAWKFGFLEVRAEEIIKDNKFNQHDDQRTLSSAIASLRSCFSSAISVPSTGSGFPL